jgi:hypothetical protein
MPRRKNTAKENAAQQKKDNETKKAKYHLEHPDARYQHTNQYWKDNPVEYRAYLNAKQRRENKSNPGYKNYGERGVAVLLTFPEFLDEAGTKQAAMEARKKAGLPEKELSIDRIDNSGDYEHGNLRWITRSEEQKNRRKTDAILKQAADARVKAAIACKKPTCLRNHPRTPENLSGHNRRVCEKEGRDRRSLPRLLRQHHKLCVKTADIEAKIEADSRRKDSRNRM